MRVLLFILLEVVFAPLQTIGSLIYALRVRFVNMPRGISGTAYEPYMTRLMLHHTGRRSDEAAEKIALHLPALSPLVLRLLMDTLVLAVKWSGFKGSFFAYPGPRPSTVMTFINHRTHFFDSAVAAAAAADSPIRQFVVLGAGWDTRFYGRLPGAADLRTPAGRGHRQDAGRSRGTRTWIAHRDRLPQSGTGIRPQALRGDGELREVRHEGVLQRELALRHFDRRTGA
ncbi:MAG: class I SAM-dependent methyltransferase [Acidobacteria bacterium]|nr:class I SAM-dependent methyltransferase [Acidobacteriota bacterium]